MAKIFKPRRGKKSTMAGTKKTTVLSAGEMFIEVPDTGAGTGHSKMKIGDGSTQYSSLPYAMGDTENDKIAFSNDTSSTATAALNKVTSGAALKTLIAGLKQAVSLTNTSITQLNDDISGISNNISSITSNISNINNSISKIKVYVGSDGKLHFINSGGADTVLNFNSSRTASGQEYVGNAGRIITINCGFRPNRAFTYNTTRYSTYLYDSRIPHIMFGYVNGNWHPMSDYRDTYFVVNNNGFSFSASYSYDSDTILWFAAE